MDMCGFRGKDLKYAKEFC